jgi:hypothetical protein
VDLAIDLDSVVPADLLTAGKAETVAVKVDLPMVADKVETVGDRVGLLMAADPALDLLKVDLRTADLVARASGEMIDRAKKWRRKSTKS